MPATQRPGAGGRLAGGLILLGLLAVAATLVTRQLHRTPDAPPATQPAAPPTQMLSALLPGWTPVGVANTYDAAHLYQIIDGQAGLYLDAGFDHLLAQRLRDPQQPDHTLQLRLYTMTSADAAASVRARQRRPGGAPPRPDLDSQCLDGACFLAHGPWYLEVLPSPPGPDLAQASQDAVTAFVTAHPVDPPTSSRVFPEQGLVAGSVALGVPSAFGLSTLQSVDTARYQLDGQPVSVWLTRGDDPEALVQRVRDELLSLGGQPDGQAIAIDGRYCALQAGSSVAVGVQEAPGAASAVALAQRLIKQVEGSP